MAIAMRRAHAVGAAIRAGISQDIVIHAGIAAYFVIGAAYVAARSSSLLASFWVYAAAGLAIFVVGLPLGVYVVAAARARRRLGRRHGLALRRLFRPERLGRFIAGTVLMLAWLVLFQAMFSSVKSALPADGTFPDDAEQARLDTLVHFGRAPWEVLVGLGHNPLVLRLVELNYDMFWFVVSFGALYWVAISPRADRVRVRYFISLLLVWIVIGNIVAGTFLSAGPAFYGFVTGDTRRFAALTQFLHATAGSPYSAADAQSYLWMLHQRGLSGFGSGISAFPSIHVAVVAMNACFALEYRRRLGLVALAYLAVIMASSVYLGWHYAMDGYAAVLLSVLLYWAVRSAAPHLARIRLRRGAMVEDEPPEASPAGV